MAPFPVASGIPPCAGGAGGFVLVAVVIGLEGAVDGHTDVIGLLFSEFGEAAADAFEVEAGDFFVEVFGKDFDADFLFVAVLPEVNLGKNLVGEGVGHDEAGVARGAAEVDEAAFGEEVDATSVGEGVFVHGADFFGFDGGDGDAGEGVEFVDLDFVVEVADVADDGLVFHLLEVFDGNDVAVACGGDVDVRHAEGVFDGEDAEAFHGGLEGADGIDLGDYDVGAHAFEGEGAAFADVAVAADHGGFAGDHHVGGAFNAVNEGFAAAVKVVEFGFSDGVVDVDGGEQKGASFGEGDEALDAGSCLFADAFDFRHPFVEDAGLFFGDFFEEVFDDLFFVGGGGGVDPFVSVFHFVAFVDEECGIAAVVHDELGAEAAWVAEGAPGAVPVFFEAFAFPGEDGDVAGGDGGGGVVLGGVDVAGSPADRGAEVGEGFDEDGGLDRHVERTGDADAIEGFLWAVFGADGHEAGHFVFGDVNFFAAKVGEGDVFDKVVGEFSRCGGFFECCWHSVSFLWGVYWRVLFDSFFEFGCFVGVFPRDVFVVGGVAEVAVVGAVGVDGAKEVELSDDVGRFEGEDGVNGFKDFGRRDGLCAEGVEGDGDGFGVADSVGELEFDATSEFGGHDVFGHPAGEVGR